MTKAPYPKILLLVGFLALMIAVPVANLHAGPIDNPNNASTSTISDFNCSNIDYLNQSDSPGLLAQAEAQAAEHHCVGHCRHHYEERLRECNAPGHEHHHRCEQWARERERECLDACYREYPR